MILNTFISAIIALFFLGRSSKDDHKKTRKASIFKVIAYAILTVIAVIIFYKSYQVSTIVNIIDVKPLRGIEDSLHHTKDTIRSISIYNKFRNMGSYNNDFLKLSNAHKKDSFYTKNGGVLIKIKRDITNIENFHNRKHLSPELISSFENELKCDISRIGSIYSMTFVSTNIPSFLSFYPDVQGESPWEHKEGMSLYNVVRNTRDIEGFTFTKPHDSNEQDFSDLEGGEHLFDNGILVQQNMVIDDIKDKTTSFYLSCSHNIANTIDLLTAADLSQYTYTICLDSEMPIKKLSVEYNIPIEISQAQDGMSVGSKGFSLNQKLLKSLKNDALMIHVKLPTMANLQLIRSLILTALLTTFFSLLCSNIYYLFRKGAMKYYREHKLGFATLRRISRHRVRIFKIFCYTYIIILLLLCLFMTLLVLYNRTIIVDIEYFWYYAVIYFLGGVIVFSILVYSLYKYATTPIPKKKGGNKKRK